MPTEINITGKKFNYLTAIKYYGKSKNGHHKWVFLCDCGKEHIADKTSVMLGYTKSCGCFAKKEKSKNLTKIVTKHNLSRTPLYTLYYTIKKRCYNKNAENYYNYGERGIKMCKDWESDFKSFYKWAINNGYKKGLTIDRIDNNKGYYPENCRFVTHKEQANNRKNTVFVKIYGKFLPMSNATKLLSRSSCYIRNHYETKHLADII